MAMTVTEAIAVNTLLNWITGRAGAAGDVPSATKALEAGQILADHAYMRLSAGWRAGEDLRGAWPGRRPGPATVREAQGRDRGVR